MILFIGHIENDKALLSPTESHHMARVLRMKVGDEVYVTNGQGNMYKGVIEALENKAAVVGNLEELPNIQKRAYHLEMAVAPTKQIDRIEFFIEKGIEIGLDAYHPIITFNSERRKINHERLNKIALAAMKQSLKAEQPIIHDLQSFTTFLKENKNFEGQKFIAHCHKDFEQKEIKSLLQEREAYLFLIGPEGDFSLEEVKLAMEHGFTPISLGNQRLRTETAALSCVMLAHWMHQ